MWSILLGLLQQLWLPLAAAGVGLWLWLGGVRDGQRMAERHAERVVAEARERMAEADAAGPRDRDAAAERLRDGSF